MKRVSLTQAEKLTLKTYEKIADQWAKEHSKGLWWGNLELFKKLLPKGRLLEIGSGGGRDAKELIKLGYEYTGTDISKEFLKIAKKNNPSGKFFHQSIYNLDFPKNYFDGFWSTAVLLHIPKSKINQALAKIHFVVKPDGIGFITLKKGNGERIIEEETDTGVKYKRLFSYYLLDEFKKILKNNEFDILKNFQKKIDNTTWLMYFVKVKK